MSALRKAMKYVDDPAGGMPDASDRISKSIAAGERLIKYTKKDSSKIKDVNTIIRGDQAD
jgi:hypothetical protein